MKSLLINVVIHSKLAFRSVQHSLLEIKRRLNQLLQIPDPTDSLNIDPSVSELDWSVSSYLRSTTDRFNLSQNVEVFITQTITFRTN